MSYNAGGRRPFERASRSSHHHIINDGEVQTLLQSSWVPDSGSVSEAEWTLAEPQLNAAERIEHIIAVDGSFAEAVVKPNYPSSLVGFMQFGALSFRRSDLQRIEATPHPAPEDMERLRNLERLKLTYPIRGVRVRSCQSLVDSVRLAIYNFFRRAQIEGRPLIETLAWMLFEQYRPKYDRPGAWYLATDATHPEGEGIELIEEEMDANFSFASRDLQSRIYLTDVLRLHEKVEEETGAGGIVGHLLSAVEQLLLLHIIRLIHEQLPGALGRCFFLRDGPLAFFGQTAKLHGPYRSALEWMRRNAEIFVAGLEKSGAFVDHARDIHERMPRNGALILSDDYIFRYIIPKESVEGIYGRNTYYGRKVIYRASTAGIHVVTIPTGEALPNPTAGDLRGFHTALACVNELRCDMYDSALFPVALANKLVSLSAHPSQRILQRFATGSVGGPRASR
jgi:hypothetical protein